MYPKKKKIALQNESHNLKLFYFAKIFKTHVKILNYKLVRTT